MWGPWVSDPYLGAANHNDYIFMYLMLGGRMRSWEGVVSEEGLRQLASNYMTDDNEIIRYRIRKPDVLQQLIELAAYPDINKVLEKT